MDPYKKEMLENINLKTIEKMVNDKNMNLLAIINESRKNELFFNEFYEIIFLKMITQYPLNEVIKTSVRYENFGLTPLKASELLNEGIKYVDYEVLINTFNYQRVGLAITALNENTLYLDSFNIGRLESSLSSVSDKKEIIEKNEKLKNYLTLDNKLEPMGLKNKLGKI